MPLFSNLALPLNIKNLTIFEQLAVTATFDTQAWQQFINQQRDYQRTQPQQLVQTQHTDYSGHSNYTPHDHTNPHTNYYNNHANSPGYHSNYYGSHTNSHSNNNYHNNYYAHNNDYSGSHTDDPNCHTHEFKHYNNNTYNGHYESYHKNYYGGHFNSRGDHFDRYSQTNTHNNYTPHTNNTYYHSNYTYHNNYSSHNDYTGTHVNAPYHTNYGFDHQNYVPSKPAFFDLSANKVLTGTVTIAMYSYDKNKDGAGSQDADSKTVRYDLLIRKVKNLDGTSNVSSWHVLLSNQVENAGEGITYDLNTIDPLGTGNTDIKASEGYYEIKTLARNTPKNGVTYESQEQVVQVIIRHNSSPQITVTNGSEFINFTFSFTGALSPNDIFKPYGSLYAGAPANMQEGILVKLNMIDPDSSTTTVKNWQKGIAYLSLPNGVQIANSTVDIIWDNGSNVTSSENQNKTGYAFFPKDIYTKYGNIKGAYITIQVSDYLDSTCTKPAGATVIQSQISDYDATKLIFNVDVTKPNVSITNADGTPVSYDWKTATQKYKLSYTDTFTGVWIKQYAFSKDTSVPSVWNSYTDGSILTLPGDGVWYIHYHAVDKAGNEIYGYFGPFKQDTTAPVISGTYKSINDNQVLITVNASDPESDIWGIQLPNGTWVTNDTATYTGTPGKPYTFVAKNNAGLTSTITVTPASISINPAMNTTYHAGQAVVISVNVTGNVNRVTAEMWYSNNEFVTTNITDLVKGSGGEWHSRHDDVEGYDKVVIIPKNTPDGVYTLKVTAYSGSSSVSKNIPITVQNTIYDYYHSEIQK